MAADQPINPDRPHKRRVRYRGTHPRRFEEKYKELNPEIDPDTVAKVIASGDTPAGQHRPILVEEILDQLAPRPGQVGADVTLGYGGHSERLLQNITPGGKLFGLDVDAKQLPITEKRLRQLGYGEEELIVERCNYAGLASVLMRHGIADGIDFVLADLGLSSMQIDNPSRGFSYKTNGPLDMRMNPDRGVSAKDWLASCRAEKLANALVDGGDEPLAESIADSIISARDKDKMVSTLDLRKAIEAVLPKWMDDSARKTTFARVFQAIRIIVNDEFSAINAFLTQLPNCLREGGRVVILSFHSGEDRRVKHHFRDGLRDGTYTEISDQIIRPSSTERRENIRSSSAKMRWGIRG